MFHYTPTTPNNNSPFDGLSFNLNFVELIKRPIFLFSLFCILFGLIVAACVSHGGYQYDNCLFADDLNACHYATWIPAICLVVSFSSVIVEIVPDFFIPVGYRRLIMIGQVTFGGIWTFLWFVGFCFLTNRWSLSAAIIKQTSPPLHKLHDCRTAIAFSFFSIFSWAAFTFAAYKRYRYGENMGLFSYDDHHIDDFSSGTSIYRNIDDGNPSPLLESTSAAGGGGGGYQQQLYQQDPATQSYQKSPY